MMVSAHQWIEAAPVSWTRGRIKNLLTSAANGVWGDEPVNDGTDVYCVRAADFDRTRQRVSKARLPQRSVNRSVLNQHRLRPGDLVLEKSGGGETQPVGMAVLFDGPEPAVCSNFCARLIPASGVDPRFLTYALAATYSQGLTQSVVKQTTGIQNLDAAAFFALRWAYPEVAEQRRIADFLDTETARIDRLISLRNSQVHRIEERYFSVISEYSTPGITSNAARSGRWPWLPAVLEVARLGYFARVQGGVTVHGSRAETLEDAEYPYLRVANVQNGAIDLGEVKSIVIPSSMAAQATLQYGDVVITEANGNPDNLGRGAVWRNEIPGMVHQNHVFAIRVNKKRLLPEYVAVLLASSHGRRYFRFTSSQVGIATTSSSKVLNFPIPVVGIDEQKQVIDKCGSARHAADRAVKLLLRQLELLTERRQALITAAVTGQVDVSTASGRGIEE